LSTFVFLEVFIKREDLQPVFSFKLRGAHNKVAHLTKQQKENGICACSAGNHAQGKIPKRNEKKASFNLSLFVSSVFFSS
jgi:hypothetical protein